MNYKIIIKNRNLRIKILRLLNFIPDKWMIKMQYRIAMGYKLNLKNPKKFTEKLQWYKLYYKDPLMKVCSDKYSVREYVKEKKLEDILVPLYEVYNSSAEINFDKLPNSFVIKTTLGGGNNQVKVVNDINETNKTEMIYSIKKWKINNNFKSVSREWGYQSNNEKIIIEENLYTKYNKSIVDYKFFCFNGEPKYLYLITERDTKNGPFLDIYDIDFNKLPFRRPDIKNSMKIYKKPDNFDKMLEIAKTLSNDFPHVRVDLYNFNGKIYFGEMTFYNGSGYKQYIPNNYDFVVGNYFVLPEERH